MVLYNQLLHFYELAVVIITNIDEFVVLLIYMGGMMMLYVVLLFVFGELVDEGVAFLVWFVMFLGGIEVMWLHGWLW